MRKHYSRPCHSSGGSDPIKCWGTFKYLSEGRNSMESVSQSVNDSTTYHYNYVLPLYRQITFEFLPFLLFE
jgi:hypothetical protein